MNDQPLRPDPPEVPERFDPASMRGEIIEAEHLARYRWAAPLAAGRRVLDAGCGTGYGSHLLAESGAAEVVGLDRAADVLDTVRQSMPAGVTLEQGDVTALPYEDGHFEMVVCFEVIEHIADQDRALDEFRRVLAPGGLLAISSPNRDVYPPGNPHHVHEYTPGELERALTQRFAFVRLERQHTWITSGVLDDERFQLGGDQELATGRLHARKLVADRPGAELYTLALAGQQELPETAITLELAPPVELRKWDALWHEQADTLERQAKVLSEQADLLSAHERLFAEDVLARERLREEVEQLRHQLARTESELARMPAIDAQARELVELNDELLRLNSELMARQQSYDGLMAISERYTVLVGSTSWKLTRPLRKAGVVLRRLRG